MSGRDPDAPHEGSVGHARGSDEAAIESNRRAFLDAAGVDPGDLVLGRQTHGTTVQVVVDADRGRGLYPRFDGFPRTDALVTGDAGVAVGVLVADCVPLLLYDRRRHALGVVHAGWRGTVGLIAERAVETMTQTLGTDPADVTAGIGPSIGPCCYRVGDEVVDAWHQTGVRNRERAVMRRDSGYHYDLWMANRLALLQAGVARGSIEVSTICVRCAADRYFSYRAARLDLATAGGMMLVAQLD
jgi:YfiH family protein